MRVNSYINIEIKDKTVHFSKSLYIQKFEISKQNELKISISHDILFDLYLLGMYKSIYISRSGTPEQPLFDNKRAQLFQFPKKLRR